MTLSRGEGVGREMKKVFPPVSSSCVLCACYKRRHGSLPFVVVRPFSSEGVSFSVSCTRLVLRLVACLPSVSSPPIILVSLCVSFLFGLFSRSRSIVLRPRLSCFVGDGMRTHESDEEPRWDEENEET